MQTDLGREKKLRERLEVQCHELEREIETVRRSGSRPSQHSETAKEVAKYVFAVEISVFFIWLKTNELLVYANSDFLPRILYHICVVAAA